MQIFLKKCIKKSFENLDDIRHHSCVYRRMKENELVKHLRYQKHAKFTTVLIQLKKISHTMHIFMSVQFVFYTAIP